MSERAIYVATSDHQVLRWPTAPADRLKFPQKDSKEELIISHQKIAVQDVFVNHEGYHALVTVIGTGAARSCDVHYLHLSATRSILLHKLHEFNVQSVAWSPAADGFCTREVLLGTDRGVIIELCLDYDYANSELKSQSFNRLIEIPGSPCIAGVFYQTYFGACSKCLVLAVSANTLYQFSGDVSETHKPDFVVLFNRYKADPSLMSRCSLEVGGSGLASQLQCVYKRAQASSFA